MKKILNIKVYLMALLAFSFMLTSCDDDNEEDLKAPRIFRPTAVEASVDRVNAKISWGSVPGAVSYTLQLFLDEVKVYEVTTEETFYQFTELNGGATYVAKVMANAKDASMNSRLADVEFSIPVENLFNNFRVYNGVVDVRTVQVQWQPGNTVTHLSLVSAGETLLVEVSEAEREAGRKLVQVAENNVQYTISLINNENVRGTLSLKVEGDVFLNDGDDITSAIASASNGQVLVLESGRTFVHEGTWTMVSGVSLTIKGGPGLVKPVFAFNNISGSTCISQADPGVGYLRIDNIELTGAPAGDKSAAPALWHPHFINKNGAGGFNEMVIENSIISMFGRNFIRYRSTSHMDKLTIHNSIVNFTGATSDYAVVVMENDSYINEIVYSNSTFVGSNRGLVRNNSNVPNALFHLKNCTVNDFCDAGRFMVELKSPIASVVFENSILGKTRGAVWNSEANTGGVFGMSPVDGAVFSSPGSYALSDFSQNLSEVGQTRKIDVPAYGRPSGDVFQNPDNVDYRIKDAAFGGRGTAGDPRWW